MPRRKSEPSKTDRLFNQLLQHYSG
ncbi:hypothetical protein KR51_00033160, partial [Rubidibacter lacunae KORDI 51-2]